MMKLFNLYGLLSLVLNSDAFVQRSSFNGRPRGTAATTVSKLMVDGILTQETTTTTTTPEERAAKAKQTWTTIALQQTEDKTAEFSLKEVATIYDYQRFDEFLTVEGTYFINGLGSCEIGDRLVHPFEAHGFCKSLVFDGQGQLRYTSRLVETPLNQKERDQNRMLARGVMSTVADFDIMGSIQNALSPINRDTANLVAHLWPPPSAKASTTEKEENTVDTVLITCTDNGEPFALDPKTLKTLGRLVDVIPKLRTIFPDGTKFLAHTRYDEARERLIMMTNKMDVPGETYQGNSTMEFFEFDAKFDLVSRRAYSTRFMVCHDWVITEHYYVVPKNPAYLKWPGLFKFLMGRTVGTAIFDMEEETNGEFLLIPRHDSNEPVHQVQSDAFFNLFHFGPCFERTTTTSADDTNKNEMVIHGCVFDTYTFGGEMGFDGASQQFDPVAWGTSERAPAPRLDKFVIDLTTFQLTQKERIPVIPVDMPTFDGDAKALRYSYFLGASRPEGWFPFRQIVKLDLETFESCNWDAGDGSVVSEPMFVPRQQQQALRSEDDGFVVSIVHNAEMKTCRLVIWDSLTFDQGPIAEVPLGDLTPWCVHGSFVPNYNPFQED